jgi:hypothetical protein
MTNIKSNYTKKIQIWTRNASNLTRKSSLYGLALYGVVAMGKQQITNIERLHSNKSHFNVERWNYILVKLFYNLR